jgi:hypothetical protein
MRPACLLGVCLLFGAPALAGGRFTWERSAKGQPPVSITLSCEAGDARMETGGEKNRVLIWDATKKVLTILDPATKSYLRVDPEQLAGAFGRTRPADDEPPLKRTGKKSKVGPWECEQTLIRRSGQNGGVEVWYEVDACIVPWARSPVKAEELGCLKPLIGALDTLGAPESDVIAGAVEALPGLPVRTVRDTGDSKTSVSTFKSFQRVTVAPEAFSVPADYAPHVSR